MKLNFSEKLNEIVLTPMYPYPYNITCMLYNYSY